jgi:hypothetical protein
VIPPEQQQQDRQPWLAVTRGQEQVIEGRQQPGCAAVGEQVDGKVLLAAAAERKLRVGRRLQGKRREAELSRCEGHGTP